MFNLTTCFQARSNTASRLARIGSVWPIGNKVTTVNIAGFNWDLFVGPNGSMKVFSFIPADGSWKLSFNADVKLFFNYLAQNQGYPASQQNLIGTFFVYSSRRANTNNSCSLPAGYRAFHWLRQVLRLQLQRQHQHLKSSVVASRA